MPTYCCWRCKLIIFLERNIASSMYEHISEENKSGGKILVPVCKGTSFTDSFSIMAQTSKPPNAGTTQIW